VKGGTILIAVCILLLLFGCGTALGEEELNLAQDGQTSYQIVEPATPSAVDEYAVGQLAKYLQQMTGAEFPIVEPEKVNGEKPCIFIGLSDPALKRLDEADPLAFLEDQEHVCCSRGSDILLYGKGIHGNLWAVMEFLENSLGWRWFSVHEEPVVPKKPTIMLQPFQRKRGFWMKYRQVHLNFGRDFYYLNGINMGYALKGMPPPYISKLPATRFAHVSTSYIPPLPSDKYADGFQWQNKKNYFETNPDFFSMDEFGKRVPNMQLCYSNPALREELTRNVIRDIELNKHLPGDGLIVTIDAADIGGKFCHCPGCKALEEKYQSPGGPIFDYLIELCGRLQEDYPNVMVRTFAYRRSQTQYPLILPDGGRLPENLIVSFAPIEDAYQVDWWNCRDAKIQGTYHDMLGWSRITPHLWAWIYPNPWGTGSIVPIGNIERIVNNMRLMKIAGVEGLFVDHEGINHRNSFHELQAYLLFKLMKDVDCDVEKVIKEFTDYHYGAAGALMRNYIRELEEGRKEMGPPPGVTYKSKYFDAATFPYLTPERIYRWQQFFDQMEAQTADQPKPLLHVQTVRRKLDFATLWKWLDLAEKYPEYFDDYQKVADRIRRTNAAVTAKPFVRPVGEGIIDDFVLKIKAGGKEPPLPKELSGVDPSRVRQYVPSVGRATNPRAEDEDAAFGYAASVYKPDMPFNFGFYQNDRATRDESLLPKLPEGAKATWQRALNKKFTLQREISADEIVPEKYQLYKLGEIEVTPKCIIWFSAQSWQTQLEIGSRLYEPGAGNRWAAYASIKFDGPTYGGTAKEDLVLVDRVILISLSEDQFKTQ